MNPEGCGSDTLDTLSPRDTSRHPPTRFNALPWQPLTISRSGTLDTLSPPADEWQRAAVGLDRDSTPRLPHMFAFTCGGAAFLLPRAAGSVYYPFDAPCIRVCEEHAW